MKNKWDLNSLERYRKYQEVLERPTFNSIEDARENMRAKEGEFRHFVVREPLGIYRVCYCFLSIPRGSDEQQWTYNEEYRFSQSDYYRIQQRAALEVGIDLIGGVK